MKAETGILLKAFGLKILANINTEAGWNSLFCLSRKTPSEKKLSRSVEEPTGKN